MGTLFQYPVSNGIQFVESWTGMRVKVDDMFFPAPKFLHASYTFEDKANVSFLGGMNTLEGVHEMLHITRLFYFYDLAFGLHFLIKFEENLRTGTLTVGKTIQDGKIGALTKRS